MIELALQGLLVVLLLLTITWCIIVHYRLRRLRTDRGELEAFIAALDEATGRAEAAVRQMREANAVVEGAAREQERRARQQTAELARLMDNAVRVVQRLDAAVEHGATRVAELRTVMPTGDPVRMTASPSEVLSPAGAARSRPVEPGRAPPPVTAADPAPPGQRPLRPVRRKGQLGGLLHGELLEALQGLR